ncbi:hypothetical protein PIB30_043819, partial [Stylosanthes scabra]|nr:hypothetical protein [Stylosanthes scabra]
SSIGINSSNRNDSEYNAFLAPFTYPSSNDTYLTDSSSSRTFQNNNTTNHHDDLLDFGFTRPDFRPGQLAGTVDFYRRHVFLCYKSPAAWPPRIEAWEFDRLPRLLHAAVVSGKGRMKKETLLTICEGHDGTETSNGDMLIFPDMVRYRRLTHFDVETFVEEVLVNDGEWRPGNPEALLGSYVFVCSHGSRDRRCGACGPVLVSRFREETEVLGLQGKVFVSPCSHIGRHKCAGNVIIFGSSINGEATGHWYGYVTPEDVPSLLQQHIIKGEILDSLWRGQMGLTAEEQKKSQEQRIHQNCVRNFEENTEEFIDTNNHSTGTVAFESPESTAISCQENGYSSCHQDNHVSFRKTKIPGAIEPEAKLSADDEFSENVPSRISKGKAKLHKLCSIPTWLDYWEQEDTYAALAVVCAAVSVVVAYRCYKQS